MEAATIAATSLFRVVSNSGPFRLLVDSSNPFKFLNYAVPIDVGWGLADIDRLVKDFAAVHRNPRLEFTDELWPGLANALLERGFSDEGSNPKLACQKTDFSARTNPLIKVEFLNHNSDIATAMAVQERGFSSNEDLMPNENPESVIKWRNSIKAGIWRVAVGKVDGKVASIATGISDPSQPGPRICEICGVTTLPSSRKLGAATTLISELLLLHFEENELAWLAAGSGDAQSVYEKLGFRVVAMQRNLSLETT